MPNQGEDAGMRLATPRISGWIRSNILGLVAIYIALGGTALAVQANSVGTKELKKNAVGTKQLKKNAVKTRQVARNAVRTAKVANEAITTSKLADRSVTAAKLDPTASDELRGPPGPPGPASGPAGGDLTGSYPNPTIAAGAVGTGKLADGAVNSAKVADGSLTGADIDESTLGEVPLAASSNLLGGLGPDDFLRTSPRQIVVRAADTAEENGQALRDALDSVPAASAANPVTVQLTAGIYAVDAAVLDVPAFVTLRGAGRRASHLRKEQEPVDLNEGSALRDIRVSSFSAFGPSAVRVIGTNAIIEDADLDRRHNFTSTALRVNAGASVTVRDAALTATNLGDNPTVRGLDVQGTATVLDTTISVSGASNTTRGVDVGTGGTLTMLGSIVDVTDDVVGGLTVGLHLAGSATVRDTMVAVSNEVSEKAIGIDVPAGGDAALAGLLVTAESATDDDAIRAASASVTVEASQLEAGGGGSDVGVRTSAAAAEVKVGTSRISAPTPATGPGTETCAFAYNGSFSALSAACT